MSDDLKRSGRAPTRPPRRSIKPGVVFTVPALGVMAAIVGFPLLYSLSLSFSSLDLLDPQAEQRFVGLRNYTTLLRNPEFRNSVAITTVFVILTVSLEIVVGMAIALLLNQRMRGLTVFRLIICLPLLMAPSVAGLQFRFLFADQYGGLNAMLERVGVAGPLWLVSSWAARGSVLLTSMWLATPFVVLVLLAGMANLPEEPFEAARMDGASGLRSFWHIMLPMLRPALLIIIVVRMADAFRIFDVVYLLTAGGPGRSTDVLSNFIYRETFVRVDLPEGAAASFLLIAVVGALSYLSVRVLRPRSDGRS